MRTGIAGRSAELVALLAARGYAIDLYPERAAHDFPWRHRLAPYDCIIYQFGNSSHHDYEWPYALRYPGVVVLHDTRLHHARAALLLRERRAADYRAEFAWNHPEASPDAAELAVAGFDSFLFYEWPMVASLIASARLTAVHGEGARAEVVASLSTPNYATPNSQPTPNSATPNSQPTPNSATPNSQVVAIRLGEGETLTPEREAEARARVRGRYGIAPDTVVFGVFGGLTPEKRVPQILAAFRATLPHASSAHLLLAGAPAAHYDVAGDVRARGLGDRVTLTGYLESDEALTDHLAACDVSLNLRWPTARETSGPWLRALAAARATIVTDLAHLTGLATLDPRTWRVSDVRRPMAEGRWAMGDVRWPTDDGRWAMDDRTGAQRPGETADVSNPAHRPSDIDHRTAKPPHRSAPVSIAIDILDEDHSLRLAMRRLATDPALRAELGAAARAWWERGHTPALMADDYERLIEMAIAQPPNPPSLPPHMRDEGLRRARALLDRFGLDVPF